MISVAQIKKYGTEIGLDVIRVASANLFSDYVKTVQTRIKNRLIPAESQDAEDIFKRLEFYSDPKNSLPRAKTILSKMLFKFLLKCVRIESTVDANKQVK